jgi:hypothetical protein
MPSLRDKSHDGVLFCVHSVLQLNISNSSWICQKLAPKQLHTMQGMDFPSYVLYSVNQFNNVFEALTCLKKMCIGNSAICQWRSTVIYNTEFGTARNFITFIISCQMQKLYSSNHCRFDSMQLSRSAKANSTAKVFITVQDANPGRFSRLCSVLSQPVYSNIPSPVEIRVKKEITRLICLWLIQRRQISGR